MTSGPGPVWAQVPTELSNPRTEDIDLLSTEEILRKLNDEDRVVAGAVAAAIPQLARLVDVAVAALRAGGRVHYVGAGTSGRLAMLDIAELAPTFDLDEGTFVGHHAGGRRALLAPVEDAEDDADSGAAEITNDAGDNDVVVGLTASGRTPYVLGALAAARRIGASTALISSNPYVTGNPDVDIAIVIETGCEAISGSTRMKAGTAQKLVLTSLSTAVMIRTGHTYSNLMVSMRAGNTKLRGRTLRVLLEASGGTHAECVAALAAAEGDLKAALVHLLGKAGIEDSVTALSRSDGSVRDALALLAGR